MNRDQIKGDWHQWSRLKEKRKKLTDAGLKGVAGKRDELEGILAEMFSLALPFKRAAGECHVTLYGTVQYALKECGHQRDQRNDRRPAAVDRMTVTSR